MRRVVGVVALGLAGLALVPVPGTLAQSAGGSVDSEGWWNAAPVETPVTLPPIGVAPPPAAAPAPDVPDGAIAVGVRLGRPARVAALGIVLDAERGSTVTKFELKLKEAAGPFAQQGSEPKVQACPLTSFLVPEEGGAPTNIPAADCNVGKAEGVRGDDGTWTFDLTPIASAWLDPFGTFQANGIRLDAVGEPPATFQVAFTGKEDAVLTTEISPPAAAGADPFASGGGSFDVPVSSGGTDFAAPTADVPAVETPAAEPEPAPQEQAAPVAASRAGDTFGNWPGALLLLLVLALGLALAMAWVLGPAGRQRTDLARRQGGVSRALAARLTPSNPRA